MQLNMYRKGVFDNYVVQKEKMLGQIGSILAVSDNKRWKYGGKVSRTGSSCLQMEPQGDEMRGDHFFGAGGGGGPYRNGTEEGRTT